jgi:hypothetical protein
VPVLLPQHSFNARRMLDLINHAIDLSRIFDETPESLRNTIIHAGKTALLTDNRSSHNTPARKAFHNGSAQL